MAALSEAGQERRARLIAFYLPQFHPIPENDAWWGAGFTEWTNVTKAVPRYRGHEQPRLPADLGFYDLRLPEARAAQARLAREYGIHGFCYYHYWFNGRRLLERPFDAVRRSGEPDLPFCLCWANESWTRAWDGGDQQLLLEQTYSDADDLAHIRWLAEVFGDPRYIRVDGKPLFLVYRADTLPDAVRTTRVWRDEAVRLGIGALHLVKVDSFSDRTPPEALGFDAALEFQPDVLRLGEPIHESEAWQQAHGTVLADAGHRVFDYADVAHRMRTPPADSDPRIPCVVPGWDNSARRERGAVILHGSTPDAYGAWLGDALTRAERQGGDPLVFVNAWNEWAEGAHLEPSRRWGRAYLDATKAALEGRRIAVAQAVVDESSASQPPLNYVRRYDDPDHSHTLVLELVKGAGRVLDVGAATGYLSEAMAAGGAEVVAVEPDPRSASLAAARGIEVRVGTLDETMRPEEQFDCVLVADVLEHVVDGDLFLESALRHVRPGGHLVLSVPNIAHISMRGLLLRGHFDYADTGLLDRTHVRFYTAASLAALLAAHGLEVVDRRYSVGPSVLRRLRPALLDRLRRRLFRSLAWRWPSLFALQFIYKLGRVERGAEARRP